MLCLGPTSANSHLVTLCGPDSSSYVAQQLLHNPIFLVGLLSFIVGPTVICIMAVWMLRGTLTKNLHAQLSAPSLLKRILSILCMGITALFLLGMSMILWTILAR